MQKPTSVIRRGGHPPAEGSDPWIEIMRDVRKCMQAEENWKNPPKPFPYTRTSIPEYSNGTQAQLHGGNYEGVPGFQAEEVYGYYSRSLNGGVNGHITHKKGCP